MKKIMPLLLAVIAMCTAQMQAQDRERGRARTQVPKQRDLKIMVRDTLGNRVPEVDVAAAFRGSGRGLAMARKDGAGDHFLSVTDADTLDLLVFNMLFEIAAEGTDSLLIINRNAAVASGIGAMNHIEAITVTASREGRQRVGIGYSSIAIEDLVSWGQVIDMKEADKYVYVSEYLRPRLRPSGDGPGLIVVDGVPLQGGAKELEYFLLAIVESIYFDKMGTIYGARGAGGVLFITTKGNR